VYKIKTKRIYADPADDDGIRVLVDRLWPRGIRKEDARIDHWLKELSPSTELRKWYGHDVDKWAEFKRRYFKELEKQAEPLTRLRELAAHNDVTLLYGARAEHYNNAVALLEYLENWRINEDI